MTTRTRTVGLELGVVAVAVAALLGIGLASSRDSAAAPPAAFAWSINLAVSAILLAVSGRTAIHAARNSNSINRSGTLVVAGLNALTVAMPGATLVWRSREATVERLLGVELATQESLTVVIWGFTAAMLAFAGGDYLTSRWGHPAAPPTQDRREISSLIRTTTSVLFTVGLAAHGLSLSRGIGAGFETRGEAEGQGLLSMASWSLHLAIAVSVLNRHWGSRWRVGLSLIGLAAIVLSGVRSPLLLIAVAALPRLIKMIANSRFPLLVIGSGLIAANTLVAVGAGISSWRGNIRAGLSVSLLQEILDSWVDPIGSLSSTGVDTLDGALFVTALPRDQIDVSLADPLKAFTLLIPRQIFPEKPELISNILSRDYLGFGAAGMFLSGVGYLTLVLGSTIAAIFAFGAIGAIYGRIFNGVTASTGWLISTYILLRFWMGGDAFDIFLGLELALVWVLALSLAVAITHLRTRPPTDRMSGQNSRKISRASSSVAG